MPTGAWNWKLAYDACRGGEGPVPAQIRPGDARTRRFARGASRHARQARGACCRRRPAARKNPGIPTILDADRARLCRRRGRRDDARPIPCWSPRPAPGLLAIFAELAGARLILNELAETPRRPARRALSRRPGHPVRRGAHPRPPRRRPAADRRADEPALLGGRRMSRAASPMPRCATSPRRWRALPRAGASSPSPAPISRPTIPPGATASCGSGARPRRVLGGDRRPRSMRATARRSRRA